MIFDRYYDKAQSLDRIQVGHHIIVRSSTPSKCIICGTETHWRDSDDMQAVCEKECLFELHYNSPNIFVTFTESLKTHTETTLNGTIHI